MFSDEDDNDVEVDDGEGCGWSALPTFCLNTPSASRRTLLLIQHLEARQTIHPNLLFKTTYCKGCVTLTTAYPGGMNNGRQIQSRSMTTILSRVLTLYLFSPSLLRELRAHIDRCIEKRGLCQDCDGGH